MRALHHTQESQAMYEHAHIFLPGLWTPVNLFLSLSAIMALRHGVFFGLSDHTVAIISALYFPRSLLLCLFHDFPTLSVSPKVVTET